MSGFFRKLMSAIGRLGDYARAAIALTKPSVSQALGLEKDFALLSFRDQMLRVMKAMRNDALRRTGRSKYTPHQGRKERAKWARRFRTWHQPRGNGDQYVYASFKAALA